MINSEFIYIYTQHFRNLSWPCDEHINITVDKKNITCVYVHLGVFIWKW